MHVLVATEHGLFSVPPDGPPTPLVANRPFVAVAFDGTRWWAITAGDLLRAADDGGVETVASIPTALQPATCLLVVNDRVVVGTHGPHLLELSLTGLRPVPSFTSAPGRHTWHTPWGGPPAARGATVDAHGRMLVNVHVGGIVRHEADGTWNPLIDIHDDVHQVVTGPDGELAAATGASALAMSDDAGATWHYAAVGLHGRYLRAIARTDQWLVFSASSGPFSRQGRIYRTPIEHPAAIQACDRGLPTWFDGNVDTGWIAAAGRTVVAATPEGRVFRSDDEGAHWDTLASGLTEPTSVALVPE